MDAGFPKEKYCVHGGSCTVLSKEHEKSFPYPDWQDQPFTPRVVEPVVEPKKRGRPKRIEEAIEVN